MRHRDRSETIHPIGGIQQCVPARKRLARIDGNVGEDRPDLLGSIDLIVFALFYSVSFSRR